QFAAVFDDQIAVQFLKTCVDQFGRMLEAPAGTVFAIDGVRRPYYLGCTSAARIAKLADGDVYTKTVSVVEALQQIGAPTLLPAQLTIRTPDGETARYAVWNPRHETLLPPCDYVLIRESATTKIRVPHARIADVVASDAPGVSPGAPLDELQWLLGALEEAMVDQLIGRAGAIGRRLNAGDEWSAMAQPLSAATRIRRVLSARRSRSRSRGTRSRSGTGSSARRCRRDTRKHADDREAPEHRHERIANTPTGPHDAPIAITHR